MRPVTPSLSKQFDDDDAEADDDDDDDDDECYSASPPIRAVRVDPLVQALPHYQVVAIKAGREEQTVPVFNRKIKTAGSENNRQRKKRLI